MRDYLNGLKVISNKELTRRLPSPQFWESMIPKAPRIEGWGPPVNLIPRHYLIAYPALS